MPDIDFYILTDDRPDAAYGFSCRLIDKAFRLGHRVAVNATDPSAAQRIDELLWTFQQEGFLPHAQLHEADPSLDRIIIGPAHDVAKRLGSAHLDVLINLDDAPVGELTGWQRLAEVVSGDTAAKKSGRSRFRHYRDLGFDIKTHNV